MFFYLIKFENNNVVGQYLILFLLNTEKIYIELLRDFPLTITYFSVILELFML